MQNTMRVQNRELTSSTIEPPRTLNRSAEPQPTTDDNVRVVCRVRPFDAREIELANTSDNVLRSVVAMEGPDSIFLDVANEYTERERFHFYESFWSIPPSQQENVNAPFSTQETVYNVVGKPAMEKCWQGYNTCIFAYGQTGSGKTHTMMGSSEDYGVIPRLCRDLFQQVQDRIYQSNDPHETQSAPSRQNSPNSDDSMELSALTISGSAPVSGYDVLNDYTVEASCLEIYQERVRDLLGSWDSQEAESEALSLSFFSNDAPLTTTVHHTMNPNLNQTMTNRGTNCASSNSSALRVRNFPGRGPVVVGLTQVTVQNWETCRQVIEIGLSRRTVASTKMNEESSRSHCIFALNLKQERKLLPKRAAEKMSVARRVSHINLVDLAGSERTKKSGVQGVQLKEAASINKSLTVLKEVIDALVERKTYIPYRDSLLTWLLSESLGGNSRTFMIACVSPHADNADETLSTLRYAARTQGIQNRARVNDTDDYRHIQQLENEIQLLQEELRSDPCAILQNELQKLKLSVQELQLRLEDANYQAKELERAHARVRERKYASELVHKFRLRQTANQTQATAMKVSEIETNISKQKTDLKTLSHTFQSLYENLDQLHHCEEDLVHSLKRQQSQVGFWRSSADDLESQIEEDLRSQLAAIHIQSATISKDSFALLDGTRTDTLSDENVKLRDQLQQELTENEIRHLERRNNLIQACTEHYRDLCTKTGARLDATEVHCQRLKEQVRSLQKKVDHLGEKYQRDRCTLKKRVEDLHSSIDEEDANWKKKVLEMDEEYPDRFNLELERLKKLHQEFEERYQSNCTGIVQELCSKRQEFESSEKIKLKDLTDDRKEFVRKLTAEWECKCITFGHEQQTTGLILDDFYQSVQQFLKETRMLYARHTSSEREILQALHNPLMKQYATEWKDHCEYRSVGVTGGSPGNSPFKKDSPTSSPMTPLGQGLSPRAPIQMSASPRRVISLGNELGKFSLGPSPSVPGIQKGESEFTSSLRRSTNSKATTYRMSPHRPLHFVPCAWWGPSVPPSAQALKPTLEPSHPRRDISVSPSRPRSTNNTFELVKKRSTTAVPAGTLIGDLAIHPFIRSLPVMPNLKQRDVSPPNTGHDAKILQHTGLRTARRVTPSSTLPSARIGMRKVPSLTSALALGSPNSTTLHSNLLIRKKRTASLDHNRKLLVQPVPLVAHTRNKEC